MTSKTVTRLSRLAGFAWGIGTVAGCANSVSGESGSGAAVAFADAGVGRPLGAAFLGSQPSFGLGGPIGNVGQPPPISGGTLLVTFDGSVAIASDPDRDQIYGVDLTSQALAFAISLQPGDQPGRIAEDGAGRIHVALRGGGAMVTIDPRQGTLIARRSACPAPRGVAWAASTDVVWVACATGELVALPAAGGTIAQSFVLERDLRDVIAEPDGTLTVTKFRSAEVLRIAGDGTLMGRTSLPPLVTGHDSNESQVAWRTIAGLSLGSVIAVYQVESTSPVSTVAQGGYGGGGGGFPFAGPPPGFPPGDGGIVLSPVPALPTTDGSVIFPGGNLGGGPIGSVLSFVDGDGIGSRRNLLQQVVLPVDVALSPDGKRVAVASAGSGFLPTPSVWLFDVDSGAAASSFGTPTQAPVVAVAFDGRGNVLAQTLEPAQLLFVAADRSQVNGRGALVASVSLSKISQHNTGSDIFHTQAGAQIACASCHPEGGDDGHVWMLDGLPRRTPSLRGTIAGTAPYHWPGDELNMNMLIDAVYTRRMGGAQLDTQLQQVLTDWVEHIAAPPAPSWIDAIAVQRGRALFEGPAGCSACHSGERLTNNATVDVGTGRDVGKTADGGAPPTAFQVPPLVGVGWRTPLFHDGCADKMADRFGKCATPGHGATAQLSEQDVRDLSAYLESL